MTERATIGGWKRTALAVAVAYALALQGLLLALGGAMHAQASVLPETVLCLQDSGGASSHDPATTDHKICCLAACVGGTGPMGPAPAVSLLPLLPALSQDLRPTIVRDGDAVASAVLPVGSRAPPRLG